MSGTSAVHFDKVRELHSAVRDWIERSAVAQNNNDIRANLPYVDLMFAFGFATLGDHPTANKLTEDARRVMEGPIPEGESPQTAQAVTAAVVSQFMFKAFKHRIEQALGGKPLGASLSAEVVAHRDAIGARAGSGAINNPYKLAAHMIDKFREQSRVVEPFERVDPYADWTKRGDALKRELAELHTIRDPAVLTERIRTLYREGLQGKSLVEVQFRLLHEALPLAPRVSEAFTVELLAHVPAALRSGMGTNEVTDLPMRERELLEGALFLAVHFGREDIVKQLVDEFIALVRSKPEGVRFKLINVVTRQCVRSLRHFGLTNEIDRLLTRLHGEVLDGLSAAELRKKHAARPEGWAAVLQTLVNLAGGWLVLGLHDRAAQILAEARNELLNTHTQPLQPKDYTELARAYVAALGQSQPAEAGLNGMIELFSKMDLRKISNTWTTAQYYSRLHLNLVEDTVLAVCQLCNDDLAPAIVSA